MPQEVIDREHQLATNEKQGRDLLFYDRHKQPVDDDDEAFNDFDFQPDIEITGVNNEHTIEEIQYFIEPTEPEAINDELPDMNASHKTTGVDTYIKITGVNTDVAETVEENIEIPIEADDENDLQEEPETNDDDSVSYATAPEEDEVIDDDAIEIKEKEVYHPSAQIPSVQ